MHLRATKQRHNLRNEAMLHVLVPHKQWGRLLDLPILAFLSSDGDCLKVSSSLSLLLLWYNNRKCSAVQLGSEAWILNNQRVFFVPTTQVPFQGHCIFFLDLTDLIELLVWHSRNRSSTLTEEEFPSNS